MKALMLAVSAAAVSAMPLHAEPVAVGAAKIDVTPTEPVVLAGYGSRTKEYEGIDTKLWARAMVIGDKEPVAIVALDNCGVPAAIKAKVAARLSKHGIAPERLVVAVTHTHNAPNLLGYAPVLWAGRTTPEMDKRTAAYTEFAITKMEAAVVAALKARKPLILGWAQGRATFGGNRRVLRDGKWAGFGFQRKGPVDHSLPVLVARNEQGKVHVVWANYACHCTTVGSRNHVGGDWAGYANDSMEEAFPHAVALMTIGCGADVGPQPSGNLQIAASHGAHVGTEVKRLLTGKLIKLTTAPSVASKEVRLPLEEPKPRKHWESELKSGNGFHKALAKAMLAKIDAEGSVPTEVPYPVSAWKFGSDLAMVFLPGEVVVDYSVRLNRELDWSRLWITAWANDMPGYIPSKRVLAEGGYEAEFSQVYYEQPGRYRPEVEDIVVKAVHDVVGDTFAAKPDQEEAPFHKLPSGENDAFKRLAAWASSIATVENADSLMKLRKFVPDAKPAISKLTTSGGEETEWHNFAGDFVHRRFIRQEKKGAEITWRSPAGKVLCFSGGVGWRSQPKTDGFALLVGGEEKLRFDVTQRPAQWASKDGSVELLYVPTWESTEDTGGFFFIAFAEAPVDEIAFAVRSLGEGSKRWFAIDSKQAIPAQLKSIAEALKR